MGSRHDLLRLSRRSMNDDYAVAVAVVAEDGVDAADWQDGCAG